jgi:hypothetical protein
MVNAAIDDCSITKLKIVVLDELHMIDDDYRGYLMELMATKMLCLSQQLQIVGMSATLTVSSPVTRTCLVLTCQEHQSPQDMAARSLLRDTLSTNPDRGALGLRRQNISSRDD